MSILYLFYHILLKCSILSLVGQFSGLSTHSWQVDVSVSKTKTKTNLNSLSSRTFILLNTIKKKMVQLHSLMVLYSNTPSKKPVILCGHTLNSSWFGWMYKDALTEFAMFVSKLLASKVKPGQRIAVKEQSLN